MKIDARRFVYNTMVWSRAMLPVIALLAGLASSVRTIQTTAEIYLASGTSLPATIFVSLAFTFAAEGSIFVVALAREQQQIKWRQARKKRHVLSLKTFMRGLRVRLGMEEPLSYDQLPENNYMLNLLIFVAFIFAMISNINMGIRPLVESMGSTNIQSFIAGLSTAKASIQMAFTVDLASVIFPPVMALVAGHLTARYASEILGATTRAQARTERKAAPVEKRSTNRSMNKASERVTEYLNAHPEAFDGMSQNQIARELGVSVGTVNAVFKTMKADQFSSNGHERK